MGSCRKSTDVLKQTARLLYIFAICAAVWQQHRKSSFARVIGTRMDDGAFIAIQSKDERTSPFGVRAEIVIRVFFVIPAARLLRT